MAESAGALRYLLPEKTALTNFYSFLIGALELAYYSYPMRRILLIVLIIGLLLSTAIGGAWWYLQRTLAALPIADLDYRISAISYKHMRLEHLSFTYLGDSEISHTDVPAQQTLSTTTGTQFNAPVALEDVFITWEWHGFRPELQIVEAERLEARVSHWPEAPLETQTEETWQDWQVPSDWRLQRNLPHRIKVNQILLDLPCDERCQYSGSLHFSSDNKQRFSSADQPQHTELHLALSPHATFSELQHINIRLDYTVSHNRPTLDLLVHSPMGLSLNWSQQLTQSNRLRGDVSLNYHPAAEWMFTHAAQWDPQIIVQAAPFLEVVSDALQLQTDYDLRLPGTSLQRWVNEVSGEINMQADLYNQLSLDGRLSVERDHEIEVNARLHSDVENAFVQNLLRQLPEAWRPDVLSPEGLTLAQLTDHPTLLLTQWQESLQIKSYTRFRLPPGLAWSSWPTQAVGRLDYEIEPFQHQIEQLGRFQSSSQGSIDFDTGILNRVDIALDSQVIPAPSIGLLNELDLDVEQLDMQLRIAQDSPLLWHAIPLTLNIETHGETALQLSSHAHLSASPFAISSEIARLQFRQNSVALPPLSIDSPQLQLPFSFQLDAAGDFSIEGSGPAQWFAERLELAQADDVDAIEFAQLHGIVTDWRLHGSLEDLTQAQLHTSLDTTIQSATAPLIKSVPWRHRGELRMQPFAEQIDFQLSGRLSNTPGLLVRHQAQWVDEHIVLDWELADIFWLAGNPIARTIEVWPELLQLERGRSRASGQLVWPLEGDSPIRLDTQVEMHDVAGIFDTIAFNGLRAELGASLNDNSLIASLDNATVQRLEAGIAMGPGQLSAHYEGSLDSPMQGQLRIENNQLSVLNGSVSLRPQVYQLDASDFVFYVDINQLDIARLLAEYPATELQGSGLLSGVIPVRWTEDGFFVDQGTLASQPPGGQIQYRSERARQMAQSNVAMDIVMRALDDFHYSELQGAVHYQEDGKLSLGLLLEGSNPALEGGRPVRLEVTIEEDLPALLASLQLVNQLNEIIQERVQQRLIERLRN